MRNNLHVLILPSWYPMAHNPLQGVFFREQAQALYRMGLKVGVVCPDLRSLKSINAKRLLSNHFQVSLEDDRGVPTLRFKGWNIPVAKIRRSIFIDMAKRLTDEYIRKYGTPDLIHAHCVLWGGVAANQIGRHLDIPYIITEHSSRFMYGNSIKHWHEDHIRIAYQNASLVVTVSNALRQSINPYIEGRTIKVVPNIVDTKYFTIPSTPPRSTTTIFTFITVALLVPIKGIDRLIRAFANGFIQNPNVVLEIGGDGPQRTKLEKLAISLRVREKVRFLGRLSREQVRDAMWRANAFILPSHAETFGVVLIEAMSVGLPVIATACGGPNELITNEIGILVEPHDELGLEKGMKKIYCEREGWLGKQEKISKSAAAKFSSDVVVNQLMGIYRKTVS